MTLNISTSTERDNRMNQKPIGIFYENPTLFKPLFDELRTRKIPFVRINALHHQYNPSEREPHFSFVINLTAASTSSRNNASIFRASNYLAHLERLGVCVINGVTAHEIGFSKVKQLSLLTALELPFPKTRIINHTDQIIPAALSLRFPVLYKLNSEAKLLHFDTYARLQKALDLSQVDLGCDHTALVQEFITPKNGSSFRVETLNGKYLYAIKVITSSADQTIKVEPFTPQRKLFMRSDESSKQQNSM